MAAENTDYSNDIRLRISPNSGKIIVEELKRDGAISFKEISPIDLYFMLNESYRSKRHYEQVLRRELDGLDEEFESLKLLSQELSLRASGIRFQRAA